MNLKLYSSRKTFGQSDRNWHRQQKLRLLIQEEKKNKVFAHFAVSASLSLLSFSVLLHGRFLSTVQKGFL